jgi:hypothetical protein
MIKNEPGILRNQQIVPFLLRWFQEYVMVGQAGLGNYTDQTVCDLPDHETLFLSGIPFGKIQH